MSSSDLPEPPKIKLYTNHGCGWSQRVQITLRELNLAYEEVLMDLDQPRPDWFLKLNPVCMVPHIANTDMGVGHPLQKTMGHVVQSLTRAILVDD